MDELPESLSSELLIAVVESGVIESPQKWEIAARALAIRLAEAIGLDREAADA